MPHQKTALITGITGQDGSYLAELLLAKDYQVLGLVSHATSPAGMTYLEPIRDRLTLIEGDLMDRASLEQIFVDYPLTEIYNLGGITFVPAAWEKPALTLNVNTVGVAYLLELMVAHRPTARLFQASSAKIFGNPADSPQTEQTTIAPTDPYGVSKAASHLLVQSYRPKGIFAATGILYNHESERRGPDFVTRKITRAAAAIKHGSTDKLTLGYLDAQVDWGYAPDYVEGMWRMLNHTDPDDFLLATGELHTIREICEIAFGRLELDYQPHVATDAHLSHSTTTTQIVGDSSKARRVLGWQPQTSFAEMIERMVDYDYQTMKSVEA